MNEAIQERKHISQELEAEREKVARFVSSNMSRS